MSTTIDQRVVEMRFDNKQFESGVSTTLSTLDKLKQKLNLTGTSKGLDELNTAVKKVDMSRLGGAVESVSAKFSAMQVMGVTALANITNSAVNAGKRIVKSLTIDPIQTGFNEYELKMGSVQTIMAGTGETLDRVNQKLNELNEYSDQTIYSFKDMTDNIGKFTNAGVNLDDAVAAIKGISNAAALSGANSNEASRAMYNFSQALSSGYVQLTDWRSIELANMATSEFRKQLIEAAVATGSLKKKSEGLWETLEGSEVTVESFRTTLQDKWLTSDALVHALNQYADGTTDVGKRATAAATQVKTFSMMMDTLKESAQSGWAQTWELLVGDFEEAKELFTELSNIFGDILGKSADRRNNLISSALDSNWDKFVKKIGEAGVDITDFETSLKDIVGKTKFDKLIDEFGSVEDAAKNGKFTVDELKNALSKIGSSSGSAFDFSGMADKVKGNRFTYSMGGLGKTSEEVKQIQTALNELGYDLSPDGKFGKATYQAVMAFQKAEGIKIDGIVGEETIAALQKAVGETEKLAKETGDLSKDCEGLFDVLTKRSGRELLFESLLNIITVIRRPLAAVGKALRSTFTVTGEQIYNVLEKVNKFTSDLALDGILDVKTWAGLSKAVTSLGVSWDDFKKSLENTLEKHGVNVEELVEKYGSLGKAFEAGAISMDAIKETLLGFEGVRDKLAKTGKTADKLLRLFKGIFSILKIFTTFAGGAFSVGFRILQSVLEKFDIGLLEFAANVGDAMVKVSDYINGLIDSGVGKLIDWLIPKISDAVESISNWINSIKETETVKKVVGGLKSIPSVIESVTTAFENGIKVVSGWIDALKETEFFQTVSGWINSAYETIKDALVGISNAVDDFNISHAGQQLQAFGGWVSDLASDISKTKTFTTIVSGITSAFTALDNAISNFDLSNFSLAELKNFANWGRKLDGKGAFGGVKDFVKGFAGVSFDNFKWNWNEMKTNAIAKFGEFWSKNAERLTQAFESGKKAAKALKEFVFGTDEVNLPKILGVVEKFLGIAVLYTALKTIQSLTSPFDGIASGLNNLAKGVKWRAIAEALKAMAIALGVMTACIVVLVSMGDLSKAADAAKILGGLIVTLGVVIVALSFVMGKIEGVNLISSVGSILAIVIALSLLVGVISKLDTTRLNDPLGTFTELFAMLMVLALGVKMVSAAGSASFGSIAAILTMITALGQILDVIQKYDEYPWEKMENGIHRMIDMMMFLAIAIRVASGGVKAGAGVGGLAFTLIAMIGSLYLLLDIIKKYGEAASDPNYSAGRNAVMGLLGFMTLLSFMLSVTGKTTIDKDKKVVNNFAGLALALLVVVGAIYVLGKMAIEHRDVLIKGGNAVGQVLLAFAVMLSAIGFACRGVQLGSVIALVIGIGLIVAELWYIIKDMQSIPWQSALSSAGALALVLGAMAAVFKALGSLDNYWTKAGRLIPMLIILGGIIAVLGWVLIKMKDIPWQSAIGSATGLAILLGAMVGVFHGLSGLDMRHFSKSKLKKLGVMFLGLSAIMLALGFVLAMTSGMGTSSAIQNAIGLSILLGAMAGVFHVLSGLDMKHFSDSKMKKIYAMFAGLTGILLMLAVVLALMSTYDTSRAIPNAIALSVLLTVMGGVVKVLSSTQSMDWKKMGTVLISMTVLTAILYAIAGVLAIMNGLSVGKAIGNVVALSGMLIAMSYAMTILSKSEAMSWQKMGTILISMTVLTAILYAIAGVIKMLDGINATKAIGNVVALSIMLNAMAIAMRILSGTNGMTPAQMMGAMISMSILSVILYLIADVLKMLNGINPLRAIGNVVALSIMLNAMASALLILNYVKHVSVSALGGMAGLVAILYLMLPAMQILNSLVIPIQNAVSLSILLNAMAAALVILQNVYMVSPAALLGMLAMTGIVAILAVVMAKVAEIRADTALTNVKAISILLLTMTGIFVVLGLAGSLAATAVVGAGGLMAVIFVIGAAAIAIGNMMSAIPTDKIQSWMTGFELFIEFIVILAEGIGKIASGFIVGFTDGLAEAGENLKNFANSFSGIDPNVTTNVATLCDALNTLIGSSFLNNINDWLFGEDSLSKFGDSVASFATSITDAAAALANVTDEDAANLKRGAEAAVPLAELANAIPKEGGVWQKLAGESDLSSFGKKIVAFAECLIAYSEAVSQNTIDSAKIQQSATAAGYLTDLNDKVPMSGGIWQQIAGEADLASWGKKIVAFAQAIIDYSAILNTGTINSSKIQASATAAGYLADLNSKLTADDGVWQKIAGSKDLGTFGDSLVAFGTGLVNFSAAASSIDDSAIESIKNMGTAVDEINKVVDKINETGGFWEWVTGGTDINGFGTGLTSVAKGITDFVNTGASIDESTTANITNMGTAIDEINLVIDKLPDAGDSTKAYELALAVSDLASVAATLNSLTTSEYNYNGLFTLKGAIYTVATMLTTTDTATTYTKFSEVKGAVDNALKCAEAIDELKDRDYSGVDTLKTALTSLSGANVQGVIDAFSGKAEAMANAVSSLVNAMSKGLSDGANKVRNAATDVAEGAANAAAQKTDLFKAAGRLLGDALSAGIKAMEDSLDRAGKALANSGKDGAREKYQTWYNAGGYLVSGFAAGIIDDTWRAKDAAREMARKAAEAAEDELDINSPSKVFRAIGYSVPEGFAMGIDRLSGMAQTSAKNMANGTVDAVSKSISRISDVINSDIDAQPTIRPVLDLSDVRAGANSIGAMLNTNSLGVTANVGAISTMMGNRSQNGANAEVVSAINKLRKDLGNVGNTTYSINGVTYDDGSNIKGFAQAIVHQARLERRV